MALVHHAEDEDAYDVGYEEGKLLLPSHVLSEAFGTQLSLENDVDERPQRKKQQGQRRTRCWNKKSNRLGSKGGPRVPPAAPISPYQNPRYVNGGPGTQVFFLNSFRATSGTGVFIPQRPYTASRSTKKSASAQAFIPPRSVQALPYIPIFIPTPFAQAVNFGLHAAMGIPFPPAQVPEFYPSWGEEFNNDYSVEFHGDEEEIDDDALKQCFDFGDEDDDAISYPEMNNLPEEWTY